MDWYYIFQHFLLTEIGASHDSLLNVKKLTARNTLYILQGCTCNKTQLLDGKITLLFKK